MGIAVHDNGMIVATGDGVQVVRLITWKRAARLAQVGLKTPKASVKAWREQTPGSKARTWADVEREAQALLDAIKPATS